jgi:hypothetical protein
MTVASPTEPFIAPEPATSWRRSERLVVTIGAMAAGAGAGLFATLMTGRTGGDYAVMVAAPVLSCALLLSIFTLWRAWHRSARGCATAAMLQILGIAAWPLAWMLAQTSPVVFWIAPALALSAIALFASCWQGRGWAIYGGAAQALLLTALAAHQAMFVMLGA